MYGENMKEIDFQLLPQNQEFPRRVLTVDLKLITYIMSI